MDNPAPSGTSLGAEARLMLGLYTGDQTMIEAAEGYLRSVAFLMDRFPSAAGHSLALQSSLLRGTRELAIVGTLAPKMAAVFWAKYRPHIVLAVSAEADTVSIPLLEGRRSGAETLAYLCTGFACLAPVETPAALAVLLESV